MTAENDPSVRAVVTDLVEILAADNDLETAGTITSWAVAVWMGRVIAWTPAGGWVTVPVGEA